MNYQILVYTCYGTVCLLSLAFSIVYLTKKEFMPYHSKAVNKSWSEVDFKFQILIKALMRVSGGGFLCTFFSMLFILLFPFENNEVWSIVTIPLVALSTSATSLIATLMVKNNTDANPPWKAAVMSIILIILGFIFSIINLR